jgi:ABC-2 type transport system permease protein
LSNFIRLVQNENMKLYRKRSTKIILFFFLLFLILGGILARTSYSPPTGDWQTQLKQENLNLEQERSLPKGNRPSLEQIDNQIAENNYRLVHDLSPLGSETAAQLTQDMSNFFILAIVFALMTSGSVVSSEFNKGTVKLWMIRPVNRSLLLLSKYVSQLLFMGLLFLSVFILSILLGLIFYGGTGWDIPFLSVQHAVVHPQSAFTHLIAIYGFHLIEGIVVMTFSFMLSTVTLNAALATGLALFLELTKPIVSELQTNLHWLKYDLFTNLDLTIAVWPNEYSPPMSLTFSLILMIIYYVLFLAVSWIVFNKRDVK